MQNPITFKKKVIATTVASIMAAGFSSAATAQDNTLDALEEIVVTGIRGSLQRSLDVKRTAVGVVDAISAEDIGKMPDTNLAESLQRIPGVSIDRVNGEGSKVTVRGLDGGYNLVTLNSRQMPASSFGTSRSFDFANLASEGVSGVEVYKSGRADVQSGGMGALINILTPRPLSSPGLKAVVGAKAVFDDSSALKNNLTPEISGLFSNTFADDTIGVSLTGSYQERNGGARNASVSDWFAHATDGGDWAGIPEEHQPGDGRTYAIPAEVMYTVHEVNRKRLNSQLTFQYQPVEQLTITADYLYVKQENEGRDFGTGFWFTRDNGLDIEWSDTNPAYPLSYTENSGWHEINSVIRFNKTQSELKSAGLNVKWEATDNLTLELDAHNSESYSGPNGKWGGNNQFNFGSIDNYRVTMDFSGKFPVMNRIGHEDGRTNVAPDPARTQLTNNIFRIQEQESSVDEYQLKGTYTFDDGFIDNIKAGVGTNEISNRYFFLGYQAHNQGSWAGVQGEDGVGDIPQSYWIVDNLSNYFDHGAVKSPNFQNGFVRGNWHELLAIGAELYGSDTGFCPRAYCTTRDPELANDGLDDQTTVETSDFAYVQFGFKPEIAGMPANLAVGVRYETTDVESTAYVSAYTPYITWNSGNEYSLVADGSEYGVTTGSYSKTLPNVDFDIALTDDIKARASFSKTIARPNYNDLKGGFVWGTAPRNTMGSASAGDPNLKPMESTNFDISVEWYYADSSYVSLGFFKKDVVDFIGSSAPQTITDSGFHTPVGGPRWNAAVAAVGDNLTAINQYIVANYPASSNATNNHVYALPEDPILPFEATRPINNEDVSIDGIEIAIQHTFGESGYGFQANATLVDSDTKYNNVSKADQFAIYGLSDSANLIGFYDKDGLQVRVAYNWRDDFLAGGGGNPRYTEAYGQVDASISYEVTDNLTVSLEGLNITNENTRQYGRHENLTFNYIEMGARYNLGVRYNF